MDIDMVSKDAAPHYTWGEDCDGWVLLDSEGLSVKQESMPPGTKEKLHYHTSAQQFFFILKGTATFYINSRPERITAQQGIHIMPGEKHFIANETADRLDFFVISQPSTNHDRTTLG